MLSGARVPAKPDQRKSKHLGNLSFAHAASGSSLPYILLRRLLRSRDALLVELPDAAWLGRILGMDSTRPRAPAARDVRASLTMTEES